MKVSYGQMLVYNRVIQNKLQGLLLLLSHTDTKTPELLDLQKELIQIAKLHDKQEEDIKSLITHS